MEWTTSLHSSKKIIMIETSGIADEASSLEMAKGLFKIMFKHRTTRCLIDHSKISSVSGKAVDIYDRPKKLHGIGVPFKIKIAEVVQPKHKEFFRFLETVCRNRGFVFSLFEDKDSAIEWLLL